MRICLSVETTTRNLGVSLHAFAMDGSHRALKSFVSEPGARQSELVVPTITRLLKECRLKHSSVSLLAADIGPGSFTGVRVGLAVARTLAQGLGVPLVGVSSLEAMAWRAAKEAPQDAIIPWVPATTGEVYFACYKAGRELAAPAWRPEKFLKAAIKKHQGALQVTESPRADDVAEAAIRAYCRAPASPRFHFENVTPLYLQPSWAERSKRPS